MATFIVLNNFTDQGIRNVKETRKRAEALREMAKKHGVTVREVFWTLGTCDVVVIFDAPSDEAMTTLGLAMGQLGNVRTQTLRAYSDSEMKGILAKL